MGRDDEEREEDTPQPRWARNMESRLLGEIQSQINDLRTEVINDGSAIVDTMEIGLANAVASIVSQLQQVPGPNNPGPAVGIIMTIGGNMGSVSLSVDLVGQGLILNWADDKGDITADVPAGATLTATSSDSTVSSVGAVVANADGTGGVGPLSFFKAGTTTFTGQGVDSTGAPMAGFVATEDLTLKPGPAATLLASIASLAGAPPVPVPVTPPTGP